MEPLDDPKSIHNILEDTTGKRVSATLYLGRGINTYHTRLTGVSQGRETMQKSKYLHIDPLEEKEANQRLTDGREVTIEFSMSGKSYRFKTSVVDAASGGFRLYFPAVISIKERQRDTARVEGNDANVCIAAVKRPRNNEILNAELVDLSPGGVFFTAPPNERNMDEGIQVEVEFHWGQSDEKVSIPGKLVRITTKNGKYYCNVQFINLNFSLQRSLGELIAYIQRASLKQRKKDKNRYFQ